MAYERLGLLSEVEPVLHRHGYSTGDCAVLFAIANAENTNLTKEIDAGNLDPYSKDGLNAWCRAGAASIAFTKGLTERFVFGALQKLEFDGLIEVLRRTRTRGGIEKRSFSWPDWRRLNLPAFKMLERGLPHTAVELDAFVNGAKRIVTRLDYSPYLMPEDILPADRDDALQLVEESLGWEGQHMTVTQYNNRYHRDTVLVFLRSVQEMQEWNLYACVNDSAGEKLCHCIGALRDQPPGVGPRAEFGETAPWIVDRIEGHLPVILAGEDDGYHFRSSYQRDRALEYLKLKLDSLNWFCLAVEAIDQEGVSRPSIKTFPIQPELSSAAA